jgi:deoxyribonuclease IV
MTIRIGFHVSIVGGISKSVDNASKIGCGAFQIFSRNPRGWAAKPLVEDDVKNFQIKLAKSSISRDSVLVHMPYLPNLASPDGELYRKSVDTLATEMHRCSLLGISYLVIHLGSHLRMV